MTYELNIEIVTVESVWDLPLHGESLNFSTSFYMLDPPLLDVNVRGFGEKLLGSPCRPLSSIFMWTFTQSVEIHILRSCSFPDWDGTFRDNSSQPFRKLSRVFGESEVLEPRVNVKLAKGHKESITQFH